MAAFGAASGYSAQLQAAANAQALAQAVQAQLQAQAQAHADAQAQAQLQAVHAVQAAAGAGGLGGYAQPGVQQQQLGFAAAPGGGLSVQQGVGYGTQQEELQARAPLSYLAVAQSLAQQQQQQQQQPQQPQQQQQPQYTLQQLSALNSQQAAPQGQLGQQALGQHFAVQQVQTGQQSLGQQFAVQQQATASGALQQTLPATLAAGGPLPAAVAAGGSSGGGVTCLNVEGCSNPTVAHIIRGTYLAASQNHGRTVFRKSEQVNSVDVLIYYWDERDGASFCGWWFGPKVGGDQVWAYGGEAGPIPPGTGWRVPYDGPVDATLSVRASSGPPGYATGQQQQPQQQQLLQQLRQQQALEAGGQPLQQGHPAVMDPLLRQQQIFAIRHQQQQEAERRRQEELERLQEAEQRRLLEEERRRYEENRRAEEEYLRWQEDERRRRAEEERRRLEQYSALLARKAIQRVTQADSPDQFEALLAEVRETLTGELPKCGAQADRICEELDKATEHALQRFEDVRQERKREEERRQEEERLRSERAAAATALIREMEQLVDKAEAGAARFGAAAAPLMQAEAEPLSAAAIGRQVSAMSLASDEAHSLCRACTAFLVTKRAEVEQARLVPDAREELVKLQLRIHKALETVMTAKRKVETMYTKARKKESAMRRLAKQAALFKSYDTDGDGVLSPKEVAAFAKGEFAFEVPAEVLAKVIAQTENGSVGIPLEKLHRLRLSIAIAREEEVSRVRRREAMERAKKREERKSVLQAEMDQVSAALDKLVPDLQELEAQAEPLRASLQQERSSQEASDAAEKVAGLCSEVRSSFDATRRKIRIPADESDEEWVLRTFLQPQVLALERRAGALEVRLVAVEQAVQRARDEASRLRCKETVALRTEAGKVLRAHMSDKKLSLDELFAAMDKSGKGLVDKEDFVDFFAECEGCELERDRLEQLFTTLETDGAIVQDVLLTIVRVYYRCVKEVAMTTSATIAESKPVRRLEVDEVVEFQDGPITDAKGITRMLGCAVRDGTVGWVTLIGNSGSVFLEIGGNVVEVMKETTMTRVLESHDGGEALRRLRVGEKLEVFEWDKKDEASGEVRLRVKPLDGGALGWATKVDARGVKLLKPSAV